MGSSTGFIRSLGYSSYKHGYVFCYGMAGSHYRGGRIRFEGKKSKASSAVDHLDSCISEGDIAFSLLQTLLVSVCKYRE